MRRKVTMSDLVFLLLVFIVLSNIGTTLAADHMRQMAEIWWIQAAGCGLAIGGMMLAMLGGMALAEILDWIHALRHPEEDESETEEENKNE